MTTEAEGKRLEEAWRGWLSEVNRIRSEAVAARNAEIAEAVRGLTSPRVHYGHCEGKPCTCGLPRRIQLSEAAVLAIVERP